jgi:Zn-dependent peptidase ImmA (M78 family)
MTPRASILNAQKRAAVYLDDSGARDRIKDGYTRIDPLKIAESRNLSIFLQKLDRLLGAFVKNPEPGILINNDRPTGLIHMTCAHELGHFAMGHGQMADETIEYGQSARPEEGEADAFAYALMAPRWLLAQTLRVRGISASQIRSPSTLYQLALRLGLSYAAMVSTFVRMGQFRFEDGQALRDKQPQRAKAAGLINDQILERHQDLWILGPADKGCILEPRADDRFVLAVPNHLASGYLWTLDEARSEGFTLVPRRTSGDDPSVSDSAVPSPTAQYAIEKVDGTSTATGADFRFAETQPWRPRTDGDTEFQLRAEFEINADGMSAGTKRRRLEALRNAN